MKKSSTLIIKKTIALSLLLVSSVSVYAMELPPKVEYEKNSQKSFKAELMSNKIDECFKYIEGQKEKNKHYCTLASEALTCVNRPEGLLNILKRIEDSLSSRPTSCTLIHLAAEYNDLRLLSYLVGNQMPIDFRDDLDETPFFYAARGNAIGAMKLLKDWGANINAKARFDETPMHIATIANAIGAMELLKHWGTDINAKNRFDETPFHYAAEGNAIEAMKLLKQWGADSYASSNSGSRPLHLAAQANAIEAMKLLKQWGADINARSDWGMPMHYAARNNALEAMKLLKQWDADVNAKNKHGETPLHHASYRNAIGAMKLLKDWGADINAKNGYGETPLYCATRDNAIEAIKFLKDCCADCNAKVSGQNWYTGRPNPLEVAIWWNIKESMDFLSFLGANMDSVNADYKDKAINGWKCFELILKISQIEPSQVLDDKEGMKLLREAVENGLFCSVRRLLSLGKIKDINQKNDEGYAILHEAVNKNKIYVVKILLTTPGIEPYSRTYGTMENCPTCKAQTPYDKILKTHPGWGCQTCGSRTAYDQASAEISELYDEMKERIAIICCLKKLGLPKELAYIIFRLSNYLAKRTHLPKGLFHKALKVQEEKQNGGEEQHLKFEAQRAEIACEQKEAQAMMAAVLGDLERLKQLVSSGADLFTQDWCGYNALHFAVLHDRIDIAQYIMQCEPRTAIAKNKDGLNPIDLAIKLKKSKELLQALYEEIRKSQ